MHPSVILLLAAWSGPDSVEFKRSFIADTKENYTYKAGPHGAKEMFICHYTEAVTAATAVGASVKFDVKLDMPGLGATDPVPPLTSKVGLDNMPAGASLKDGAEFVLFGCAAGITPNKSAKVGGKVSAHWENDAKDVRLDATGKLLSLDPAGKTLSVAWEITMTPSYSVGGKFKLTTTYSLTDLSLIKSAGTFTVGATVMDVNVTRDP